MTSRLLQATRTDPPHLVNVKVLNDQSVGIWHSIEVYNEIDDGVLSGWDVKWLKCYSWKWETIVDLTINSINYTPVSQDEWERRIHDTNLRADGNRVMTQSKGIYWRRG